jgi:hypothetical protein
MRAWNEDLSIASVTPRVIAARYGCEGSVAATLGHPPLLFVREVDALGRPDTAVLDATALI